MKTVTTDTVEAIEILEETLGLEADTLLSATEKAIATVMAILKGDK